jgi:hypothetical protein
MAILSFDSPTTPASIKMLLLGLSGMGKSSSIVSLAIPGIRPSWPGRRLFVLDFDAKGKFAEIARSIILSHLEKKRITEDQAKAAFANIDVTDCRESTGIVGGALVVVGQARAWTIAVKALETWSKTLKPEDVVVVDSLTYAATIAISNHCQQLNGQLNKPLDWRAYSAPQAMIRNFLSLLGDLPSNVIITAHQEPLEIKMKTDELIDKPDGTKEAREEVVESLMAPISIGSKGRVNIPAQLNHQLVCAHNTAGERRLWTKEADGVTCKSPFFARTKDSYPISDGMVEYFALAG